MKNPDLQLIVVVQSQDGLHGRPCMLLVRRTAGYDATIEITRYPEGGGVWWDCAAASSRFLLDLLRMGVKRGEEVRYVLANPAPPRYSYQNAMIATTVYGYAPGSPSWDQKMRQLEGRDFPAERDAHLAKMELNLRDEAMEWRPEDLEAINKRPYWDPSFRV